MCLGFTRIGFGDIRLPPPPPVLTTDVFFSMKMGIISIPVFHFGLPQVDVETKLSAFLLSA